MEKNKMKKIKGIICGTLLVAALSCICGCSLSISNTTYTYNNSDKFTAGDREISDKIDTINIDYISGDITLTGSNTSTISVKETAAKQLDDKRKVHTWVDGSTLYVKYCASAKNLDLNKLDKKLNITIPENVNLSDLSIYVSSADVHCSNFTADSVKYDASSGDLDLDCVSKKTDATASSGAVNIKQTGDCDDISVNTTSGKIDIDVENATNVNASASSGDITIKAKSIQKLDTDTSSGEKVIRLYETPENTNIQASSGDVKIYLPEKSDITGNFSFSSGNLSYDLPFSKDGDKYICGNGKNQMKITTSSGDIDIKVIDSEK